MIVINRIGCNLSLTSSSHLCSSQHYTLLTCLLVYIFLSFLQPRTNIFKSCTIEQFKEIRMVWWISVVIKALIYNLLVLIGSYWFDPCHWHVQTWRGDAEVQGNQ